MNCTSCGEEKRIMARGLCSACYSRWHRKGTTVRDRAVNKGKICSEPGCNQPAASKGMCTLHYGQTQNPATMVWRLLRNRHPGQFPETWKRFSAFIEDVGERPSAKHQLRRLDPTKPYSRENVEWMAPVAPGRPSGWTVEDRAAYMREWNFLRFYGLTAEQYDKMLADQGGVCAICRGPETQIAKKSGKPRALHVDHDHATSRVGDIRVRGLTCSSCNNGLGHFKDSPALLRAAATYLEAHAMAPASTETIAVSEVCVTTEPDGGTISWTETPIAPLSLPG